MNRIFFAVGVCLLGAGSFEYSRGVVLGMDHVTMRQEGQVRELAGQVLVEAADGGVLLEDRGGMMWVVEGKDLVERKTDEEPFRRWNAQRHRSNCHKSFPAFESTLRHTT